MASGRDSSKKEVNISRSRVVNLVVTLVVLLTIGYALKDYLLAKPRDIKVSNITHNSATITWVTNTKTPGMVLTNKDGNFLGNFLDYFQSKTHYDARDINNSLRRSISSQTKRYTHYVTLSNLNPGEEYHYRISNGFYIWGIDAIEDTSRWFSVKNSEDLTFETRQEDLPTITLPKTLFGEVVDEGGKSYNDVILFGQGYPVDESGDVDVTNPTSILSTYVDENGGWVLDYSDIDQSYDTKEKTIYLYTHIENKDDIPGQFERLDSDQIKVDLFSYERLQGQNNPLKNNLYSPSSVNAAGRDLCCAMIITGKKNVYYDYEDNASCDSCGQCFPVGREILGGKIEDVVEVAASGRESCESIKRLATEGLPSSSSSSGNSGSNQGTYGGTCNAFLEDKDFEVSNIKRSEFISYANRLAGEGSQAAECYNYVVCKAKQNGINPAMMLNIWVHESAASNYKRFPGVEDMGIHCYAGAGNYPAYPCNQTPKEDIKAQTEMFGLLPHTKCLEGKFDIIKWSTGFWTGNCTDLSYGQRYYDDLKLQWSSYGIGAFPNWIKNPSSAQANLDCDTDGATEPTNNGNSGSQTPSTPTSPSTPSSPTAPSSTYVNPTKDMCCAVIVEEDDKFYTKKALGKSCEDAFPVGSAFESQKGKGTVEYGVEVETEIEKIVEPLCCAIKYEGRENLYFDYENKNNCEKCGECFKVGTSPNGTKILAAGREPVNGSSDEQKRLNCESKVRPASEGVPPDTPAKVEYDLKCDHYEYDIRCNNWKPLPVGRKVVSSFGKNNRCIDPNVTPSDDGIIDVPIQEKDIKVITHSSNKVYATDSTIREIKGDTVQFNEDGIYDIKIGPYKVSNVPINADAKYRFFEDKNKIRGYQKKNDTAISPEKISAVKVESGFRVELGAGYNFITINYKRGPNSIVVTPDSPNKVSAKMFLTSGNIDELRLIYITTYENGKWVNGLRSDAQENKTIGNSFPLSPSRGYLVLANSEMRGPNALILPGNSVNSAINTKVVTGWNLIGFTGNIDPKGSIEYVDKLSLNNNTQKLILGRWENTKGLFENVQKIDGEVYGSDYQLNNSSGYFLYSDKVFTIK